MDINQNERVQCFNCHCSIAEQETGICEVCLHSQSAKIAQMRIGNQFLDFHLKARQQMFSSQINYKTQCETSKFTFQELELKLAETELEQKLLSQEQRKFLGQLQEKVELLNSERERVNIQQGQIYLLEVQLNSLLVEQDQEKGFINSLELMKNRLERLCLLNDLYSIHFEDKTVFINRNTLNHRNAVVLLEIFSHLSEIYEFSDVVVNISKEIQLGQQVVEVRYDSPEKTLPWLAILAKGINVLWEHMKKKTEQFKSTKGYNLPLKIKTEGEVSVGQVRIRQGNDYSQCLKCLAHQLKFLINFQFSLRQ